MTTSNQTNESVTVTIIPGSCNGEGTYFPGTVDLNALTYNGTQVGVSYKPYDPNNYFGFGNVNLGPAPSDGLPYGVANMFGQVTKQAGPVVNTLALLTEGFVGGAMIAGAAPLLSSSASQITALELGPNIGARLLPTGMTTAYFGQQIMKWGTGSAAAISRIGEITLEELQAVGITREMAVSWYQFYAAVAKMNPANPSAAGRAELMKAVVDMFDRGH